MTLKTSSTLAGLLAACTTKQQVVDTINTSLGATKRIICKRAANANVADVFASGTTFCECGLNGSIVSVSGVITELGLTSNTTIQTAADLATGASVIRITGNGQYLEGSLGLPGSGADFILKANPTTDNGFAFGAIAISANRFLPTGTGPIMPAKAADAVTHLIFEDWRTGSAVVHGTIFFDDRTDDFIFEDVQVAAEIGDVGVYQSTQSLVFGDFEFGALLLRSTATNTAPGSKPLEQVLGTFKPTASTGWTNYPMWDTYDLKLNTTFPEAFKVKVMSGTVVLGTIEMHDSLPINSTIVKPWWSSTTGAIRPNFNCAQMLYWDNAQVSVSSRAGKYYKGVTADSIRPSSCKQQTSVLANVPMSGDAYGSANGFHHMYAMKQWPGARIAAARENPSDPYLFDPNGGTYPLFAYMSGWGYEPGSMSGHDWKTGPGGPRFERSVIPSLYAEFFTNPSGSRLEGMVPWRTMIDEFNKGYFNQSRHWVTNVKTFATTPDADNLAGINTFGRAYYGGGPYGPGPSHCINLASTGAGSGIESTHIDASGRLPYHGWAEDSLHAYSHPGWAALLFNSPAHAIIEKFKFNSQWMAGLEDGAAPTVNPYGFFMVRVHAWRYLSYAMSWKLASKHPLSYSRKAIEDRWQIELEKMWEVIYKPTFIENSTSLQSTCIRNFGMVSSVYTNNETQIALLESATGGLSFYMGHVLQFMKVTGSFEAMKAKSTKCADVLGMIIYCLDKASVDWILDTDGYISDSTYGAGQYVRLLTGKPAGYVFKGSDLATGWADWITRIYPKENPVQDFLHNSNGTVRENDIGWHIVAQWPAIHRDFFPEYVNTRVSAAADKFKGYYDQRAALVAAAPNAIEKRNADWTYRHPAYGILLPVDPA